MSEENKVVCFNCGAKYLTEKQQQQPGNVVTCHFGICCVCGKENHVTSIRHFNYLNPELLKHNQQV